MYGAVISIHLTDDCKCIDIWVLIFQQKNPVYGPVWNPMAHAKFVHILGICTVTIVQLAVFKFVRFHMSHGNAIAITQLCINQSTRGVFYVPVTACPKAC